MFLECSGQADSLRELGWPYQRFLLHTHHLLQLLDGVERYLECEGDMSVIMMMTIMVNVHRGDVDVPRSVQYMIDLFPQC